MRKESFFRQIANVLAGKQAAVRARKTGIEAVDAKVAIALGSARPRYISPKQVEPFVGRVRMHQLSTKGSIPGIYIHQGKQ